MTLLHRVAPALMTALALLATPKPAPNPPPLPSPTFSISMPGATAQIIIPSSSFNPQTILVPVSVVFGTAGGDFFSEDDGTVYVRTGDIPAMWLRDSSAQSKPYVRFAPIFPSLKPVFRGVIERNAKNVLTDAYANAFTAGYKLWEEKWEVDSLAYPVTLAYAYWRRTGDPSIFTKRLHWALNHTVSTYQCEQQHARCSHYSSPFLVNHGRGADFAQTGMIWGAFRPSDDPVRYPYNIPQQMFAVVALRELAELASTGYRDGKLAADAGVLADEINLGIERHGLVYHPRLGLVYAYEVDGLGHALLMDDANIPNLLSAPYYGYVLPTSTVYRNTRRFVLSGANPYWYTGKYSSGLGSPHTPTGWVWPLGLIAEGLTAETPDETASVMQQIRDTNNLSTHMHESFDPDDPDRFTRSEFGWANAQFAELIFRSAAGLDPDPLPAPVAGMPLPVQQTPLVAGFPQTVFNADTIYVEGAHLTQQPFTQ